MDTCHGFWAATTDVATIDRWWMEHPSWQLGLRTGCVSQLVVLDVDVDKGGLDSLVALQSSGFNIVGAGYQLSGSGRSFHLFYRHPGRPVKCSHGALGPGLDVCADGGYVVGAPSRHPRTGSRYLLLDDLEAQALPTWCVPPANIVSAPRIDTGPGEAPSVSPGAVQSRMGSVRLAALVRIVGRAPEGARRDTLFWAACRLGECGDSRKAILAAAQRLVEAAEEAGLPFQESLATMRDGLRRGWSA